MMNKKAIAAFAAGATLLAGFAMATPAFAEDAPKKQQTAQENLDATRKEIKELETKLQTLKGGLKGLTDAESTAKTKATSVIATLVDTSKDPYTLKADAKDTSANIALAQAYVNAHNDVVKRNAEISETQEKLNKDNDSLNGLLDAVDKEAKDKEAKKEAKDGAADQAIVDLTAAKLALKKADAKKSKALKDYRDKKTVYESAKRKFKAAEEALNSANNAVELYNAAGKNDSAELKRLNDAVNRAKAKRDAAQDTLDDAYADYFKALTDSEQAAASYNTALDTYNKDYDAAVAAGADVSAFVDMTHADHADTDLNAEPAPSPEAQKKAEAKAGKNGAAAGANGSAAAGAKAEVENKNGKDKRGNTHTGTGVGVTLTALAATMLAGMGAAVRKARH